MNVTRRQASLSLVALAAAGLPSFADEQWETLTGKCCGYEDEYGMFVTSNTGTFSVKAKNIYSRAMFTVYRLKDDFVVNGDDGVQRVLSVGDKSCLEMQNGHYVSHLFYDSSIDGKPIKHVMTRDYGFKCGEDRTQEFFDKICADVKYEYSKGKQ